MKYLTSILPLVYLLLAFLFGYLSGLRIESGEYANAGLSIVSALVFIGAVLRTTHFIGEPE